MTSGPFGLHGREAEVGLALEVLTARTGGHVSVVGAAGIGKSAVIETVAGELSATGVVVRATVGAASETDLPFVGLRDLLGADVEAGSLDLPGPMGEALEVAVLRTRSGEVDPVTLNLAVLRVVEQLSESGRLLLVLDDLPWVDAATRSALAFVLRRVGPERVMTLTALRPDAPEVDIVAPAMVRTVAVGPLDPDTLSRVIEERLGMKLAHRRAGQLHVACGGNPLLALELARTASFDQDAVAVLPVPQRYRVILAPRLEPLSADAGRALLAASLASRPDLEVLADVVSVAGILEAESAGVVRVVEGRVRFTHPLFAALCRESVPGSEIRHLHALLAKAARDDVERARHLGAATLLPDSGVAAQVEDAAEQARRRAAIEAAAELMVLAERVTPRDDLDRRTSRACTAAGLLVQAGDVEAAAAALGPLVEELAPGPWRARCLRTLGRVTSEDSEGAVNLFREALRQPGLDLDTEYELRFEIGGISANLGDIAGSRHGIARLEEEAARSGRAEIARACRAHLAWVDLMTDTPPARSVAWQQVVEEIDAYDHDYGHPDLLRAWEAMAREDNAGCLALIDGLMEPARRVGDLHLWATFALHRADAELRRGNIAAARDLTNRAYRIVADGRHDESALYFRAIVAAWQGRLDDARTDAEIALDMARADHNRLFEAPCHHALGFIELSAGNPAAAARHYDDVVVAMAAMGWRHPSLVVWHGNAVEALLAAGRRADAATLTADLAAKAEQFELVTSQALALRCQGLVREDTGDLDAAAVALDASVSLSEALDNPLEHARTLLVRGVVHRRRRQKALAREDLRRARDVFAHHGAAVWAARAEHELERSSSAAAGTELSNAERAVAQLAATGSSNREIAAELYLSEKTVEAVLTRVYRKLSVRSRTQLAHHPRLDRPSDAQDPQTPEGRA